MIPPASRKPTLEEYAAIVERISGTWQPHKDPVFGASTVWLTQQDVNDLRNVARTLRLFGSHGAAAFVKKKIEKGHAK